MEEDFAGNIEIIKKDYECRYNYLISLIVLRLTFDINANLVKRKSPIINKVITSTFFTELKLLNQFI